MMYPKEYLREFRLWYDPQTAKFMDVIGIRRDGRLGDHVIVRIIKDITKWAPYDDVALPFPENEELADFPETHFTGGTFLPVSGTMEPLGRVIASFVNYQVLTIKTPPLGE